MDDQLGSQRDNQRKFSGTETKIFDPRDPEGHGATEVYSASLAPGAPLSATGWEIARNPAGELAPLAGRTPLPVLRQRVGRAPKPMGGADLLCGRSRESLGAVHDWLPRMGWSEVGRSAGTSICCR